MYMSADRETLYRIVYSAEKPFFLQKKKNEKKKKNRKTTFNVGNFSISSLFFKKNYICILDIPNKRLYN